MLAEFNRVERFAENYLQGFNEIILTESLLVISVMADKDSHCMEDIKNVTGGCSSSFDKDYSYPTEMLIREMEANTCKSVPFDTFEHFDSTVHWVNSAPL